MSTVYNKGAFELAHARMRLAPIELTEADLDQLGSIDPALETKGREAHRQAQLAVVQQHAPIQTQASSTDDRRPVLRKHLPAFVEGLAHEIAVTIRKALDGPLCAGRLAALEQRIAELEAKPHVKFCGVFKQGTEYTPGDAVVHRGLWICKSETTGEPGKDFVAWQLAVKSRSVQ